MTTNEIDDYMNYVGFECIDGGNCVRLGALYVKENLRKFICDDRQYILCTYDLGPNTVSHAAVIWKVWYDSSNPDNMQVWIMNPASPSENFESGTFDEVRLGVMETPLPGPMTGHIRSEGFKQPYVSISDIAAFSYSGYQDYQGMELEYLLYSEANLDDSLAIYVSDNPYGPVRLIRSKVWSPLSYSGTKSCYRWGYNSCYYFYLDFDTGPFQLVRDPEELFSNMDNPIWWNGGSEGMYSPRPVFNAPSNVTVTNAPLDHGGAVTLSWDLSTDDSSIDQYNVYRKPAGGEYSCIASLQPGTSSYSDDDGLVDERSYMVSAAHHGDLSTIGPENSHYAIWNDFSDEVTGAPINNFFTGQISLISNDTLLVCLTGDEDSLHVEFQVLGSDLLPTAGIPTDSLVLYRVYTDTTYFCDGDTVVALRDTDQDGKTEFVVKKIGGWGTVQIFAHVRGSYLYTDTLDIVIKSPDFAFAGDGSSKGVVDVVDFGQFGLHYDSECGEPEYFWFCDFDHDCEVELWDFGEFGLHIDHSCD